MTPVETLELVLLLVAAVVALEIAARRIGLPPAAAFILGGAALAFAPLPSGVSLDPALALVLFLPPLLLSSAYYTDWRDLAGEARILLQLAVGAVVFTTLAVAWTASLVFPGLPFAACLALGAIVSPPDAVAAKAVLARLPLPRRMVLLLEGESLLNDATGLVIYGLAVAAALGAPLGLGDAAFRFLAVSVGGAALGCVAGWAAGRAGRALRDPQLWTVMSLLVAWAAYIAAERLHVSGVLATVACGLVMGATEHAALGARDRLEARAVWRTVAFVLESLVFVLIGLALRDVATGAGGLGTGAAAGVAAVLAVVVASRMVWIVGTAYLVRAALPGLRRSDPYPRIGVPVVMGWAGMRGVVSLAAALALPIGFPGRDLILVTTFAVIVVTVLVQGTTLGALARRFRFGSFDRERGGLLGVGAARAEVARAQAEAAERAAVDEGSRRAAGVYRRRADAALADAGRERSPTHHAAIRGAIEAGRRRLLQLHRERRLDAGVLQAIEHELDLEALRESALAPRTESRGRRTPAEAAKGTGT